MVAKDKEGEGHKANLAIKTEGLQSPKGNLHPMFLTEPTGMKLTRLVLQGRGDLSPWTSV